MNIDILTVSVAGVSFIVFLFIHFITFRRVRPESLLRSLLACVVTLMAFPIILMALARTFQILNEPLQVWVVAAILSSGIQGLLCFFYVLCVFGPYETSVRMRLVREIQKGGSQGIKAHDLDLSYNTETILNVRLKRLIGSGDLIERDGLYRIGRTGNFFFIFDAIAKVIKRWIGR